VSANFAESFVPVRSRDNLDRVLGDLERERGERESQAFKARGIPQGISCWYCNGNPDGRFETYGNDREEFENMRRQAEISAPLRIDYADKRWAIEKSYLDSLGRQARFAEKLSLVSPAGIFRAIGSAICATDLNAHENLMDRTRRYRETFISYLEARKMFSSFKWITPASPESFQSEDALVEKRTGGEFKTAKAFWEWREKQSDKWAAFQKAFKVRLSGDGPEDFPYLDVSDVPRFPDQPPRVFSGLENSGLNVGLLLVEIVFLFNLGYVAFLRFDVR
jgi:hypothetical protein